MVRCVMLGAEFPVYRQEQMTQTLIVCLMKTHFLPPILDFEKSNIELLTRPGEVVQEVGRGDV